MEDVFYFFSSAEIKNFRPAKKQLFMLNTILFKKIHNFA